MYVLMTNWFSNFNKLLPYKFITAMVIIFKILTTEIFFSLMPINKVVILVITGTIFLLIGTDKLHGAESISTYSCQMIASTPIDVTPLPGYLQNRNVNHAPTILCELSYTL